MTSPITSATRKRGNDRSTIDETTASSRQTRNRPSMTRITPTTDGSSSDAASDNGSVAARTARTTSPSTTGARKIAASRRRPGDEVAEAGDQRAEQTDAEPGDPTVLAGPAAVRPGGIRDRRGAGRGPRSIGGRRRRPRGRLGQGRLRGRLDLGGRIVGGQGRLLCATGSPRSRSVERPATAPCGARAAGPIGPLSGRGGLLRGVGRSLQHHPIRGPPDRAAAGGDRAVRRPVGGSNAGPRSSAAVVRPDARPARRRTGRCAQPRPGSSAAPPATRPIQTAPITPQIAAATSAARGPNARRERARRSASRAGAGPSR